MRVDISPAIALLQAHEENEAVNAAAHSSAGNYEDAANSLTNSNAFRSALEILEKQ